VGCATSPDEGCRPPRPDTAADQDSQRIAQRRPPQNIAATLGISEHALKEHLTDISDKLGVYENLELVLFGWIDQQLA
jgi:hypothetical protein